MVNREALFLNHLPCSDHLLHSLDIIEGFYCTTQFDISHRLVHFTVIGNDLDTVKLVICIDENEGWLRCFSFASRFPGYFAVHLDFVHALISSIKTHRQAQYSEIYNNNPTHDAYYHVK